MSKMELPTNRVYSIAFKERGRDDVVMIENFPIAEGELLKLSFEGANSPWRQGVWLQTDDRLVVNGQSSRSMVIWQDTASNEVTIECHTGNGSLHLYNVWDKGHGRRESQAWTSGMLVEDLPNGRRYRCNDIGVDADFSKLVFRLERI